MSPKEFNWQADSTVTVINPTDEKFQFQVHSKLYEVAANSKASMPGYIAWSYCFKMAQKLIREDGELKHWNDEGFRKKYYAKLVASTGNTIQAIATEPEPVVETFEPEVELNEPETEVVESEPQTPAKTTIKPMRRKRKVAKKAK